MQDQRIHQEYPAGAWALGIIAGLTIVSILLFALTPRLPATIRSFMSFESLMLMVCITLPLILVVGTITLWGRCRRR